MKLGLFMATLCIGSWAFADPVVTEVTAQQRYPWNGLVDVTVTISGASNEAAQAACRFAATNNATQTALTIAQVTETGTMSGSGTTWVRRYVWNATADLGEVKIADVVLCAEAQMSLGGVQLWENGPYWAECNVGASKSEEYGYYFWWGDTVGYVRKGGTYDRSYPRYTGVTWVSSTGTIASPFDGNSSDQTLGKSLAQLEAAGYIDSTGNLAAAHDAAAAHLGAPWRMPTDAEMQALVSNCTTTWITTNGVYGRLVTGKGAYASKSIFLPAAGDGRGSFLYGPDSYGVYWSSTPNSNDSGDTWRLNADPGGFGRFGSVRFYGSSVRPVRGFAKGSAGVSSHLAIDTRTGTRYARAEEPIAFSTDWSEGVTRLVLSVDGVNVFATTMPTNGVYLWKPDIDTSGTITLKHIAQGTGSEELTATFVVGRVTAGGTFNYTPLESTEVYSIPHDWLVTAGLAKYDDSVSSLPAKLEATYANGYTGWESYVAGLVPTNPASVFQASVVVSNGMVYVSWSPDLNDGETNRIYKVYGREKLEEGEWETPVQAWHRFFKVSVAMPTGTAGEETDVAGEGFVPVEKPLGGVQLWENGPYWAECNVGASKPEEYGYYFWWGDTVGYTREGGTWTDSYYYYSGVTWVSSTGTRMSDSPFVSSTCPTFDKTIAQLQSAGYIDSTGNLVAAHDAATVHLGAPWRMPTDTEMSALIGNCDTTWTTQGGVYGRLVKGRGAYASKSIFLPAAGLVYGSCLYYPGLNGDYWSSTPSSDYLSDAWGLYFGSSYFDRYFSSRYDGWPVRPVRGFAK